MQLADSQIQELVRTVENNEFQSLVTNDLISPDNLRDAAISIEHLNLSSAHKLMKLAHFLRPHAPFIESKLNFYRELLLAQETGTCYINDLKIRVDDNVTPAVLRALVEGVYESFELKVAHQILNPDDIVLELGAGIGFIGLSLSAKCKRYVAFEANPSLIDTLRANMALNDAEFEVRHGVLLEDDGEVPFYVTPDFWVSSLVKPDDASESISVKSFDKNKLISELQPNVLIIDIEGGEYNFFKNLQFQTIEKIIVEIHSSILENEELTEIYKILIENGFNQDFNISIENVLYWYK